MNTFITNHYCTKDILISLYLQKSNKIHYQYHNQKRDIIFFASCFLLPTRPNVSFQT
ncbi:hypothetical protein PUN28_010625 [Cardiocondyla obscurior]|uniref:Uncharacterized protein n=1 Tax=Cardiocondyla obscurior TaxID=286306 RepID=A0AAW2FMK3_9HYME